MYTALSYHYIRPENDPYPKILGSSETGFKAQLAAFRNEFEYIGTQEARACAGGKDLATKKPGLLLTFDDGLADHLPAARILNDRGIKGLFFIPTCILEDNLPPNPTIIHYTLAIHRIGGLLEAYRSALAAYELPLEEHNITYTPGSEDPWAAIKKIKEKFHYAFPHEMTRKLLLHIYENLLLKNDPEILHKMHLSKEATREIVSLGHSLGVHTRTHVSVGASALSDEAFKREMVEPRMFLEKEFATEVVSFSYPFGDARDCLSTAEVLKRTHAYELGFTITPHANTKDTAPLELGRYMPHSKDTPESILVKLNEMVMSVK